MASATADIGCPYCGWDQAMEEYESRGVSRGTTHWCDLCGYIEHQPEDNCGSECDPYSLEEPSQHTIKLAKDLKNYLPSYEEAEEIYEELILSGWFAHFAERQNYKAIIAILFGDRYEARKYGT